MCQFWTVHSLYYRGNREKGYPWNLIIGFTPENRGIEYVAKAFEFEYLNLVKSYVVQSRHYSSKRGFSKYLRCSNTLKLHSSKLIIGFTQTSEQRRRICGRSTARPLRCTLLDSIQTLFRHLTRKSWFTYEHYLSEIKKNTKWLANKINLLKIWNYQPLWP